MSLTLLIKQKNYLNPKYFIFSLLWFHLNDSNLLWFWLMNFQFKSHIGYIHWIKMHIALPQLCQRPNLTRFEQITHQQITLPFHLHRLTHLTLSNQWIYSIFAFSSFKCSIKITLSGNCIVLSSHFDFTDN